MSTLPKPDCERCPDPPELDDDGELLYPEDARRCEDCYHSTLQLADAAEGGYEEMAPRLHYPEGTHLIALDHWSGHMSHPRGAEIIAGPGGMTESADHPGHVEGFYRYWTTEPPATARLDRGLPEGDWVDGVTTGLKVELAPRELS